jgi:hypothetical protein
MAGDE